jgi:hypothetical protein
LLSAHLQLPKLIRLLLNMSHEVAHNCVSLGILLRPRFRSGLVRVCDLLQPRSVRLVLLQQSPRVRLDRGNETRVFPPLAVKLLL